MIIVSSNFLPSISFMEDWQSGLLHLFAKQAIRKDSDVQIIYLPQSCINERTTFGNFRLLWEQPIYGRK